MSDVETARFIAGPFNGKTIFVNRRHPVMEMPIAPNVWSPGDPDQRLVSPVAYELQPFFSCQGELVYLAVEREDDASR